MLIKDHYHYLSSPFKENKGSTALFFGEQRKNFQITMVITRTQLREAVKDNTGENVREGRSLESMREWEEALPGISGPIREIRIEPPPPPKERRDPKDRREPRELEDRKKILIQSLPGGWNHPDAWIRGNRAIEASPLVHILSERTEKIGHPEDPFEDEYPVPVSRVELDKETGLTEYHILTNLFQKEASCLEYLTLCDNSEARGTTGVCRVTVTDFPSPNDALPPRWIVELGEQIWSRAARQWQGLVAATIRAEAIELRAEIVNLKMEIMNRYPDNYRQITNRAYKKGTRNLKSRTPPEEVLYIMDRSTPLLSYLREESELTREEKELMTLCQAPTETNRIKSPQDQVVFVLPSPPQEESTPQVGTQSQPCECGNRPGINTPGNLLGTEPTTEQTPNLTFNLDLAQKTPPLPQESEPLRIYESISTEPPLPLDTSLDTAPTPAQEDRVEACHALIDRVVQVVNKIENIILDKLNPPLNELGQGVANPHTWKAFREHAKREKGKKKLEKKKKNQENREARIGNEGFPPPPHRPPRPPPPRPTHPRPPPPRPSHPHPRPLLTPRTPLPPPRPLLPQNTYTPHCRPSTHHPQGYQRKQPWHRATEGHQPWERHGNRGAYRRGQGNRRYYGREAEIRWSSRGRMLREESGPQGNNILGGIGRYRMRQETSYGRYQGRDPHYKGRDQTGIGRGNTQWGQEVRGGGQWQGERNGQQGWNW